MTGADPSRYGTRRTESPLSSHAANASNPRVSASAEWPRRTPPEYKRSNDGRLCDHGVTKLRPIARLNVRARSRVRTAPDRPDLKRQPDVLRASLSTTSSLSIQRAALNHGTRSASASFVSRCHSAQASAESPEAIVARIGSARASRGESDDALRCARVTYGAHASRGASCQTRTNASHRAARAYVVSEADAVRNDESAETRSIVSSARMPRANSISASRDVVPVHSPVLRLSGTCASNRSSASFCSTESAGGSDPATVTVCVTISCRQAEFSSEARIAKWSACFSTVRRMHWPAFRRCASAATSSALRGTPAAAVSMEGASTIAMPRQRATARGNRSGPASRIDVVESYS